jgi:hypothetical protein
MTFADRLFQGTERSHDVFPSYLRPDNSEVAMSFRVKQSWPRRAALAGAVIAATTLAIGAVPQPAAAQYVNQYGNPYHGHGEWGWHDRGLYRGWSKHGRGHDEWGRNDHWDRNDHRAGRTKEGFSGSSVGGRGGGVNHGSSAGGNGGAYNNWLGSHGSYR